MGGSIHLVGIGGVGMSALAQAYLDAGYAVSGADRSLRSDGRRTPVLEALATEGVHLFPDDGSGVGVGTNRLVVSTAIEDTNPDLVAARALGTPVVHRAAALSELLSARKLVAVAGTCGKSTVTAILGHVLVECGFDPLVVNGAQVVGWDANGTRVGSVRNGAGEYAVAPGPVIDGRVTDGAPAEAVEKLPMPGAHNRANARLALAMAIALGADPAKASAALATCNVSRRGASPPARWIGLVWRPGGRRLR